jgi:thioester reductase-like protein
LKLAEFAHDLKQVILKLGFEDVSDEIDLRILQKVAVSELYSILFELKESNRFARFAFKRMLSRIQNEYNTVEREIMRRDAKVEWNQTTINTEVVHTTSGSILLTGGTGFFGPFIIKSLLEQQSSDIYVLVRSNSATEGFERLKKAFDTIQAEENLNLEFNKRVKAISGDLDKFRLGLSDRDWAFLENEIHTIYHNGAMVNYVLDYESMRKANVDGTIEVLRLAQSSRLKILNYISTTFIFGWSTKDVLLESDTNEEMELLDFGYSQSKWVSEQIVHQAQQKGLPIRIFRPALISPSIDGKGYNFDIAVRLLAFMVKYGIGTSARNQVSFSPADLAANNIVAICEIPESIGKTFHVTRDEFSSMQDVTEILSKLSGKNFQHFRLKEFVPEVISRCKKDDLLFPLLNFLVRSVDNISSMEFKRYDNSNYRKYRDASPNGIPDFSLDEVVNGIYSFLVNNQIIK